MEWHYALSVLNSRAESGDGDNLVKVVNLEFFLVESVNKVLKLLSLLLLNREQLSVGLGLELFMHSNKLADEYLAELAKVTDQPWFLLVESLDHGATILKLTIITPKCKQSWKQ